MNEEDIKQLFELGKNREEKKYEWLRWVILLASGAFTLLVSFHTTRTDIEWARTLLKVSWLGLGMGILFGALALYGEVYTMNQLVRKVADELKKEYGTRLPVTAGPTRMQKLAEPLCYISLTISIFSMMAYAIATT